MHHENKEKLRLKMEEKKHNSNQRSSNRVFLSFCLFNDLITIKTLHDVSLSLQHNIHIDEKIDINLEKQLLKPIHITQVLDYLKSTMYLKIL
jgi:hypothetical protein